MAAIQGEGRRDGSGGLYSDSGDDMSSEGQGASASDNFWGRAVDSGAGNTQGEGAAPSSSSPGDLTPPSDSASDDSDSDAPEKCDPTTTFRGFPQPPVNERLESIKIFLADEDPDRYLHFEQSFKEINEYINHIEKHNLSCNPSLLKDVKSMAQAHKDWKKDRNRRLPSGCVHAGVKQTTQVSTRLIDAETSTSILETRRAVGVDTLLRTDHAPFTVNRVGDEAEFANALFKDANEDRFTAHKEKNLAWVENKAYNIALTEPAMIPYWMHPIDGLPKSGQTEHLDTAGPLNEEPTEIEKRRPYRKPLRYYLQAREEMINGLLKKNNISDDEFLKLEELLRLHEPLSIRKLYTEWKTYLYRNADGKETPQVKKLRDAYYAARDPWLDTFRYTGVYLVELPVAERSTEPGVFYLPGPNAFSPEEDQRLVEQATQLNALTEKLRNVGSYRYLSQDDKFAIDLMMITFAPKHFRLEHDASTFSQLEDDDPLAIEWREWIDRIAHLRPKIVPLSPGEMVRENPAELCIPWKPSATEEPQVPSETPIDKLWEIEALVKKHLNPRSRALSQLETARLRDLVSNFYHPFMLNLHDQGLKEAARRSTSSTPAPGNGGSNVQKPLKTLPVKTALHAELEDLKAIIDDYNQEVEENILERQNDPEAVARGEIRELHEIDEEFTEHFADWFKTSTIYENQQTNALMERPPPITDFRAKAERRGIQRAAIELALNLLATNQEQHRPDDRFRILKLPPVYRPPRKEVPSALPLESWKRPVERDTFEFTKKIAAYQRQKDFDYNLGRERLANSLPGQLEAPYNFNGPCVALNGKDKHEAAKDRLEILTDSKSSLAEAQKESPRPLLQQILRRIGWYSNPESKQEDLPTFSPLDERELEVIAELAQKSWDEEAEPYNWSIFEGDEQKKNTFLEFEKDLFSEEIVSLIPLWQAPTEHDIPIEDEVALCAPVSYSSRIASITGISLTHLKQKINNHRLASKVPRIHLWSSQEVFEFLKFMSSHSRIHLHMDELGDFQASKVPFTGHPENKYVTSVEEASDSLGVHLTADRQLAVRYNVDGLVGPPIVQPNRTEHFLGLAQRLGREILEWIELLATPAEAWAQEDIVEDQLEDALKAKEIMKTITVEDREEGKLDPELTEITYDLKLMAMELDKHAPDLARDAGFVWDEDIPEPDLESATQEDFDAWQKRQSEYAAILQMKCLEELNNNFESRFPENEKVWDFAAERVASTTRILNGKKVEVIPRQTQFFSMQKWPVECQRPETQEAIAKSGPKMPNKPVPKPAPPKPTREEKIKEANKPRKKEARHIRGRAPHFPFGETTYQQAYLSYRMEEDLKDVPEFQVKPKRWQFPWTEKKKPAVAPYSLPKIPDNWKPENISRAEKHHVLTEWAKRAPGFPDPEIHEFYHTPEEIPYVKAYEAQVQKQEADAAVVAELRKPIAKSTKDEIRAAREKLDIHPETGLFLTEEQIQARERLLERKRRQQERDAKYPGGQVPVCDYETLKRVAPPQEGGGQGAPKRTRRDGQV